MKLRAAIARVYHCPYHPLHGIGEYRRDHPWRKPKPGMILQAISDLALDPAQCPILGDKISDMEAGVAAGLGLRILLDARADRGRNHVLGHEVVANLGEGSNSSIALCSCGIRFAFRGHLRAWQLRA